MPEVERSRKHSDPQPALIPNRITASDYESRESIMVAAGSFLKERRMASGMKLRQVARDGQVDAPYLSKGENGKVPFSEQLIHSYVYAVGKIEPEEDLEIVEDTARLLRGYAPRDLTPEMCTILAKAIQDIDIVTRISNELGQTGIQAYLITKGFI